jgi:hypothetical protein
MPLGNLAAEMDAAARSAVGEEDVADIEAHEFGEPEPRAERQGEDEVVRPGGTAAARSSARCSIVSANATRWMASCRGRSSIK